VVAPLVVRPPASIVVSFPAGPADWRMLDAENTLLIDTDRGRIVIELRPEFAPLAVARIKRLARSGVYDGLQFHRVIDGFIAQTGNPNNLDGGKSLEPDLPAEFTFRLGAEIPRAQVARPQGESEGFIGAQPYVSVDEIRMAGSPDRRVSAWGAYCSGVVGMGHDADPDSGNSEFFIMRGTTRSLDRHYAVVGRVVVGLDVVRALTVGDPPLQPSRMLRARVMADLPESLRPQVQVLNTLSPEFRAIADQVRAIKGADFSICDVEAPVQVTLTPPAEPAARKRPRRPRRPPPPEPAA
jgi:peptidylprolyl isomerase